MNDIATTKLGLGPCSRCKFFKRRGLELDQPGWCLRYPPNTHMFPKQGGGFHQESTLSLTPPNHGCGEFKPEITLS